MGHHMQQQPHEHLQLVTVCMSDAFQKQDLVIAQLRQQIQDKEGQLSPFCDVQKQTFSLHKLGLSARKSLTILISPQDPLPE